MQPSTLAKRAWLLLLLALPALYLYGLGRLPFVGPDEPRYAEVAREMFVRRDLITPTLGGYPWFEKPALLYWIMMASFRLFGVSEWAARLGPAICGLLTIAAIYWIAGRLERKSGYRHGTRGIVSAMVAASSGGLIAFSHGASFDIVITMSVTLALAFFLAAETESSPGTRRWFLVGFYCFVGVSLLAKGLVGIVIPFGAIFTYFCLRRRWPDLSLWLSLIWGIPLALIVAATWYGPVIARHGRVFIDQFFVQHHFARYLSNRYHHPQPIYFYLPIIILLSLPWTPMLIDSLVKVRWRQWRSAQVESKANAFAVAWFVFPIVFFSFSGSKLPAYVLPALPAAILLVGPSLAGSIHHRLDQGQWPMRFIAGILLILSLSAVVYARQSGTVSLRCGVLVGIPLAVAAVLVVLRADARLGNTVIIFAAVTLATVITVSCGVAEFGRGESMRDLFREAEALGYGSAPVYTLHSIDRTAEFYAAGRLVYGPDGEPLSFDSVQPLSEAVRRQAGAILVIVPEPYAWQLGKIPDATVNEIGNNGKVALAVVRTKPHSILETELDGIQR